MRSRNQSKAFIINQVTGGLLLYLLLTKSVLTAEAKTNSATAGKTLVVSENIKLLSFKRNLSANIIRVPAADTVLDKVFTFVEQPAVFPGGDAALKQFLKANLNYPEAAGKNTNQALVVMQFEVDTKGRVSNPKVVKSLGKAFDEEAIRVVRLMPTFTPAKQNGRLVNFRYTLPIRFDL